MRSSGRLRVGIGLHAAVNLVFGAYALASGQVPVPSAVAAVAAPSTRVTVAVPMPISPLPTATVPASTVPPSLPPTSTAPPVTAAVVRATTTTIAPTTTAAPTTTTQPPDTDRSVERFDRLAQCESNGDPRAVNGPYRGAFQFLLETWHEAGAAGDPIDASYEAQRDVAMRWAERRDPVDEWPVCWPATRR